MITRESLNLPTPYEPPAGDLEQLIAGTFAEVFELDQVGAVDEFFDVGGDSLLGEVLSQRISERTGHDFQISALIEYGSPRQIARVLGKTSSQPEAGGRPPIFLIHGRAGFTLPKPDFRKAFGEGQELHVFELPGIRGGQSYDQVEDIAAAYVAQLIERYPQGPILLASFCVGALIALEMAAQLAALGRPVTQLVLLDPSLPKNRGVDLERGLKRKARSAHGGTYKPVPGLFRARVLLHKLRAALRGMMGGGADVSEEMLFREKLLKKEKRGRSKMPRVPQSIDARARLQVAMLRYKPRKFDGPVEILASPERDLDNPWADLLPRRRARRVFMKHSEISSGKAASLMQEIFDAALAEAGPSASGREEPPAAAERVAAR